MLQVQLIREHKEFYLEALTKRGVDAAEIFDRVLALDEKRRATQTALDETLAQSNSFSKEILLGQKYLLYFYPRDNTPGCTAQACGFRDHYCFFQNKEIKISEPFYTTENKVNDFNVIFNYFRGVKGKIPGNFNL